MFVGRVRSRHPDVQHLEPRRLLAVSANAVADRPPASPEGLVGIGDVVYYTFRDEAHGAELWKIDQSGQAALVKDINPGPADAIPAHRSEEQSSWRLAAIGNSVFFAANDGVNGTSLWKSDGTEAGTVLVADVTDAPAVPTALNPYGSFFDFSYRSLTPAGGKLFFEAQSGPFASYELWQTDGTGAGTGRVPIPGLAAAASVGEFTISELTPLGDAVALTARDSNLWRTDGTPEGTVALNAAGTVATDTTAAPRAIRVGDTVFFLARPTWQFGAVDLWTNDAAGGAPVLLYAFSARAGGRYGLESFTAVGGTLFFTVRDGVSRALELWKSDGTEAGTVVLASSAAGTLPAEVIRPQPYNGRLVFAAPGTLAAPTGALWESDGTAAGTRRVTDAGPQLAPAGGLLYFWTSVVPGTNVLDGISLWKTDGTSTGTARAFRFPTGMISMPTQYTEAGGALFFTIPAYEAPGRVWRHKDGANNWPWPNAGGQYDSARGVYLYPLDRGGDLALDASKSASIDGDPLTFSWDVNGDGVFGDATGATPAIAWSALADLPQDVPIEVRVRADDGHGNVIESGPALLTITGAPPVGKYAGGEVVDHSQFHTFTVTYTDGAGVDVSSLIGNSAAVVVGAVETTLPVEYVGIDNPTNGSPRTVTYRLAAPGGAWDGRDNLEYTVLEGYQPARDVEGTRMPGFRSMGTFAVKFRSNIPDLTATATAKLRGPVMSYGRFRATAVVKNVGTAPANGLFNVRLRLAPPDRPDEPLYDDLATADQVPLRLPPGQSRRFHFSFQMPDGIETGSYAFGARVAPVDWQAGTFKEYESSNNTGYGPAFEMVKPVLRPVLALPPGTDPGATLHLTRGRRAGVRVLVRNDGNFVAPHAIFHARFADASGRTIGYELPKSDRRLPLAPGQSRLLTLKLVVPDDLPEGATQLVLTLRNGVFLRDADLSNVVITLPVQVV